MRKDTTGYSAPKGDRNDCSVRALSIAANIPYGVSHEMFANAGRRDGKRTPRRVTTSVLTRRGDTPVRIERHRARRSYVWPTLTQFLAEHPRGRFVVARSGHAFAVVDGVVHDWQYGTGPRSRIHMAWRVTKAG